MNSNHVDHEPRHWPCGSLERRCHKSCWLHGRLLESQERLSHLLCQKAYRLLLRSLRKDLRASLVEILWLMEPEKRSCSNFSWSNSTTRNLTVDPRSLRSGLHYSLLIGRENSPQQSHNLLFSRKNWRCINSLFDCKDNYRGSIIRL